MSTNAVSNIAKQQQELDKALPKGHKPKPEKETSGFNVRKTPNFYSVNGKTLRAYEGM